MYCRNRRCGASVRFEWIQYNGNTAESHYIGCCPSCVDSLQKVRDMFVVGKWRVCGVDYKKVVMCLWRRLQKIGSVFVA